MMVKAWLRLTILVAGVGTVAVAAGAARPGGARPAATEWFAVTSPITHTLHAVAVVDPGPAGGPITNGWAVGDHGTILEYGGDSWKLVDSPVTTTLRDVAVSAAGDAWAVGDGGTVLRRVGGRWERLPHTVMAEFTGVGVGVDGWVMIAARGVQDGNPSSLVYYVGPEGLHRHLASVIRSWGAFTLNDVAVVDRTYWAAVGSIGAAAEERQVFIVEDCESQAVVAQRSQIPCSVHRSAGGGSGDLRAVDLLARDQLLAAGSRGNGLRYGEGVSDRLDLPNLTFRSVAAVSATEAWLATGRARLVHVVGTRGAEVPVGGLPPGAGLRSVDVAGSGEGWAVGLSGVIAHRSRRRPAGLALPWLGLARPDR